MHSRPEAISFRGAALYADTIRSGQDAAALDAAVTETAERLAAGDDVGARREHAAALRAAGSYRKALAVLTVGLRSRPGEPGLLTDRGHTYLNVRAVPAAVRDLENATRLDPESFDAWYHFGLARWFERDDAAAAEAFGRAASVTPSASSRLAAQVWHYTSLRRSGRRDEARALLDRIDPDVELEGKNENYRLRARLYRGAATEADVLASQVPGTKAEGSLGFGVGIMHLIDGDAMRARSHFEVAASSSFWPAFGAAAADYELGVLDGVTPPRPEAQSVIGVPLYAEFALSPEEVERREAELEVARSALASAPDDTDLARAYAKLLASGLARYRDAEAFLDERIERRPDDPALLCDRGHYRINTRRFEDALVDLTAAAERAPRSHDVWYHLGLARWMLGDIEAAVDALLRARATCDLDSHRIAYSDWLYLGLRRLGRSGEAEDVIAPLHASMKTTGNNHLYLQRILFYKGEISEDELVERSSGGGLAHASLYGLGCWHLAAGDSAAARDIFLRIVEHGTAWGAFAHIGAEVELYRGLL